MRASYTTSQVKQCMSVLFRIATTGILVGSLTSIVHGGPTKLPIGLNGQQAPYDQTIDALNSSEWQAVQKTNVAASLTLEQLRQRQLEWRNAIKSFHVDFEYGRVRKQKLAKDIVSEQQNKMLAADYRLSLSFAFKNQKLFSFYQEVSPASGANRNPIYKYAFNGTECRTHEPKRALGQIHPEKVSGLEGNAAHYMDLINMPVGPNADKTRKSLQYIPMALQADMFYHVLPKLEKVDGFNCHVVTSGWDTIWLDDAHGCCMRRRVQFRQTDAEDPGCLHYVFMCKNFIEADKGVWLPQEGYRLDYGTQMDPPSVRGVLADVNTVKTKRLEVNNVPDSQFEIEYPPGTQVQDLVNKRAFIVPGGAELLDKAIAEAFPIINNQVVPTKFVRYQFRARLLWGLNIAVIVGLLFAVVYRRKTLAAT